MRKELLEKMVSQTRSRTPGPTHVKIAPNKKTDDKKISVEMDDKNKTSNIIKDINILKAREGRGKSRREGTWTKKSSQ